MRFSEIAKKYNVSISVVYTEYDQVEINADDIYIQCHCTDIDNAKEELIIQLENIITH